MGVRSGWRVAAAWLALATLGVVALAATRDAPAVEPEEPAAVTVQRSCDVDDEVDLVARVLVDDTLVDLACGDRLRVRAGRCSIQRGPWVTEVPCSGDAGAGAWGRAGAGWPH